MKAFLLGLVISVLITSFFAVIIPHVFMGFMWSIENWVVPALAFFSSVFGETFMIVFFMLLPFIALMVGGIYQSLKDEDIL